MSVVCVCVWIRGTLLGPGLVDRTALDRGPSQTDCVLSATCAHTDTHTHFLSEPRDSLEQYVMCNSMHEWWEYKCLPQSPDCVGSTLLHTTCFQICTTFLSRTPVDPAGGLLTQLVQSCESV